MDVGDNINKKVEGVIDLLYEKDSDLKGSVCLVKNTSFGNKEAYIFYYHNLEGYIVTSVENNKIKDKMFFIDYKHSKDYYTTLMNKKDVDFSKLKNMF